jgi:hypothetical protein
MWLDVPRDWQHDQPDRFGALLEGAQANQTYSSYRAIYEATYEFTVGNDWKNRKCKI